MQLEGKTVNFLGDSITQGYGTSGVEKTFCSILSNKYKMNCLNYGLGGTRIANQKSEENDNSFCIRAMDMNENADAVIVFGGTNDYGHAVAPIGTPNDRSPETFYGALHTLYSFLLEKYTGKPIGIITPLHRIGEDNQQPNEVKNTSTITLKNYVDIIREVAEYYSLPVLDLYATSGIQPNVPAIQEKFMPDGLHPNDEGNIILARKIGAFLEQL